MGRQFHRHLESRPSLPLDGVAVKRLLTDLSYRLYFGHEELNVVSKLPEEIVTAERELMVALAADQSLTAAERFVVVVAGRHLTKLLLVDRDNLDKIEKIESF